MILRKFIVTLKFYNDAAAIGESAVTAVNGHAAISRGTLTGIATTGMKAISRRLSDRATGAA
jgi:hypothetical protein